MSQFMCLITLAYQQHPKYPFILIANRDEFYARPSSGIDYWQDHPNILAGRDLDKMGTWLGLNTEGKICALTNFRDLKTKPTATLLSRGQLINDYLLSNNIASEHLRSLASNIQNYGACNLLMADQSGLHFSSNRKLIDQQVFHSYIYKRLLPGTYGLCNASLDTPWPKLLSAKQQLQDILCNSRVDLQQLKNLLNDKTQAADNMLPNTGISNTWEKSLSSQFIQLNDYGTRAKTIILQHKCGKTEVCEQSFDHTGLLSESLFELQLAVIG
jgi:uncharacterized protein with NRDE domain